ncbi:MAG: hypothetical protein HY874_07685 [Chloroflexi bacterium]|nr:hypothetical protein [Chloroflexota bacterium]
MPGIFVIARDPRGSLIHVRHRETNECLGCVEVGLYEVLRALIVDEVRSEQAVAVGNRPLKEAG